MPEVDAALHEFEDVLGGGPKHPGTALMDSGATHCFIDHRLVSRHSLPVMRAQMHSTHLADGSVSSIEGTCTFALCLQGVITTVTAFSLSQIPKVPLILGNDWLLQRSEPHELIQGGRAGLVSS